MLCGKQYASCEFFLMPWQASSSFVANSKTTTRSYSLRQGLSFWRAGLIDRWQRIFLPLVWLGFMALWVGTLIIAILYAIKAGRGDWADYPVIGKLARKILKMDPVEGRLAPMPNVI